MPQCEIKRTVGHKRICNFLVEIYCVLRFYIVNLNLFLYVLIEIQEFTRSYDLACPMVSDLIDKSSQWNLMISPAVIVTPMPNVYVT